MIMKPRVPKRAHPAGDAWSAELRRADRRRRRHRDRVRPRRNGPVLHQRAELRRPVSGHGVADGGAVGDRHLQPARRHRLRPCSTRGCAMTDGCSRPTTAGRQVLTTGAWRPGRAGPTGPRDRARARVGRRRQGAEPWAYCRTRFFGTGSRSPASWLVCFALLAIFAERGRPTPTTSSTCSTSPSSDDRGQALVRHRPARPRLPEPRDLRPADVALGRASWSCSTRPRSAR